MWLDASCYKAYELIVRADWVPCFVTQRECSDVVTYWEMLCTGTVALLCFSFCVYCLSNALHSSIGHNIKSHTVSVVQCPLSGVRSPVRVSKALNGHNSATRHPIDFVFRSRVEFSGTADRTAPFPVGSNPRWRPVAILKKTSDSHISVTSSDILRVWF